MGQIRTPSRLWPTDLKIKQVYTVRCIVVPPDLPKVHFDTKINIHAPHISKKMLFKCVSKFTPIICFDGENWDAIEKPENTCVLTGFPQFSIDLHVLTINARFKKTITI
jgi:hypothetical protein